jgi:LuxR family maltose regulon positive regulatory protein
LCDDVLEIEGSAELLEGLERSNLFLVPLEDRRDWYRYHHREAALIPVLHWRAAAWHRHGGDVEEAIDHATAAGEFTEAGALIAARWLVVVEDADWQGALPDGISSLAFGAALTRAAVLVDDVGRGLQSARRALELAGPEPSPFHWMAQAALGQALYLSGRLADARPPLEELVARVSGAVQPYAVISALAVLSLMAAEEDVDQTARSLAERTMEITDAQGLSAEPLSGIVHLALGRALARQGNLPQAQEQLEWALELVHRRHGRAASARTVAPRERPPRSC